MTARLFAQIVSGESRKLMSYRSAFWLEAVAALAAQLAVAWFLWQAVFDASRATTIGGYTRAEMTVYYVLVILIGKLVRGQERAMAFSEDIYEGGLTRYLLYPVDYLRFKYAEHLGILAPSVLQFIVLGAAVLPFVDLPALSRISPVSALMAATTVAVGNLLNFLLAYPVQLVSFWADNVWSLSVMLRLIAVLLGGYMLPLSLFPDWSRGLLAWSPFPYLFDVPVNVLLGRVGMHDWLIGLAIALAWSAALYGLGQVIWRRGCLQYSGVGM